VRRRPAASARTLLAAILARGLAQPGEALDEPGEAAPESRFPTPEKLDELTETPLPEEELGQDVAVVPEWTVAGPFPNVAAAKPYRDPTDWGGLLETAVARRAGLVVATEAMHCAAREWGRFHLAHGAPPAPDLSRWIGARCGTSTPQIRYDHFDGGIPTQATEAEVFEAWGPAVEGILAENLVGGPRAAGIWYGTREGRAIAVVASGERLVQIAPLAMKLEGESTFVLEGETLADAESLSVWLNRGRYGVAPCERHPGLTLPRFAFRCEAAPEDRESWLTLTLMPPGRLLGRVGLDLLLFPSGEPAARWERPSLEGAKPIGPETDVGAEVARLVNGVRGEAGLEPLELSPEQSTVAEELAPYFFASSWGHGPVGTNDLVVLGLMAGWSVDGMVQSGDFTSSWVVRTLDLGHLVANAVRTPAGRRALLAPDKTKLAVGTVVNERSEFLAGVYGTYSVFEEEAHDEYARRVLDALDAARAARGKSRARILTRVAALGRLAASRVQGDEEPADVLNDLLRQSSRTLGRSVNGFFVETTDLSNIAFPEALLERDPVEVAIGVSHRREKDDPWGRFVVLIVTARPGGRGA